MNAFADRYKCNCGYTRTRLYNGQICPICHTKTSMSMITSSIPDGLY